MSHQHSSGHSSMDVFWGGAVGNRDGRSLGLDSPRITARTAILLAAAVGSYLLVMPVGWGPDWPLPWDQSGHYLDALRVADAVESASATMLGSTLLAADLYPPGHSLLLGTWMALVGEGVRAWLVLGLLYQVGVVLLLGRLHWLAAVAFLVSPLLGSLAPTVMVEPAASFLLAAALIAYPATPSRGTWPRAAAFGALTAAVLLTKYNVGLPLLPAAVLAALVSRDRTTLIRVLAAVVGAAGIWALFLALQDHGWESFLRFAENRANAQGQGFAERLGWYVDVLAHQVVPGWPAAVLILALPVLGLWRRARGGGGPDESPGDARFALAVGYLAVAMIALIRHDYLLSRNLVGPGVALFAAAGSGLAAQPPRWHRIAATAAGVVILLSAGLATHASRDQLLKRYYPEHAGDLAAASKIIAANLGVPGKVRVVGTFNEFSPGWVRILGRRHGADGPLAVDIEYPLETARTGRDAAWSPRYQELVGGWATDGTARVLALVVHPGSTYHGTDYTRWNAWKQNLVVALDAAPDFVIADRRALPGGVEVVVFDRLP